MQEAFELLPTMLSDSWVSPLVAFIDSTEGMVQSAALALLAKVLSKGASVAVDYDNALWKLLTGASIAAVSVQIRRWRSSIAWAGWIRSWVC